VAAPTKKTKPDTRRKGSSAKPKQERGVSKQGVGKARTRKKAEGGKAPSRQELGRQVSEELSKLRPALKDVGTALLDRLDGELAGLARSLDGRSMPGETPVLPQAPVLSAMLATIKALKVKPRKGRVKDLRRIETLLESLSARIPPGV